LNGYPVEVVSLAIKFSLFTGRRRGEVLGLTWSMLDLDNRFAVSPGANTKNKKTQSYPLNESCMGILSRAEELNPPQSPDDLVFPPPSGKNNYYWIDGHWREIKRKADISIRYHDLRHCYASLLASSGEVDIYHLKVLLGHRSLSMTQRYAHLFPESMRKAAAVADEVFDIDVADEEVLEIEKETERLLKCSQTLSDRRG
jgi:integrase